jgi:hypothetical protein
VKERVQHADLVIAMIVGEYEDHVERVRFAKGRRRRSACRQGGENEDREH